MRKYCIFKFQYLPTVPKILILCIRSGGGFMSTYSNSICVQYIVWTKLARFCLKNFAGIKHLPKHLTVSSIVPRFALHANWYQITFNFDQLLYNVQLYIPCICNSCVPPGTAENIHFLPKFTCLSIILHKIHFLWKIMIAKYLQ